MSNKERERFNYDNWQSMTRSQLTLRLPGLIASFQDKPHLAQLFESEFPRDIEEVELSDAIADAMAESRHAIGDMMQSSRGDHPLKWSVYTKDKYIHRVVMQPDGMLLAKEVVQPYSSDVTGTDTYYVEYARIDCYPVNERTACVVERKKDTLKITFTDRASLYETNSDQIQSDGHFMPLSEQEIPKEYYWQQYVRLHRDQSVSWGYQDIKGDTCYIEEWRKSRIDDREVTFHKVIEDDEERSVELVVQKRLQDVTIAGVYTTPNMTEYIFAETQNNDYLDLNMSDTCVLFDSIFRKDDVTRQTYITDNYSAEKMVGEFEGSTLHSFQQGVLRDLTSPRKTFINKEKAATVIVATTTEGKKVHFVLRNDLIIGILDDTWTVRLEGEE